MAEESTLSALKQQYNDELIRMEQLKTRKEFYLSFVKSSPYFIVSNITASVYAFSSGNETIGYITLLPLMAISLIALTLWSRAGIIDNKIPMVQLDIDGFEKEIRKATARAENRYREYHQNHRHLTDPVLGTLFTNPPTLRTKEEIKWLSDSVYENMALRDMKTLDPLLYVPYAETNELESELLEAYRRFINDAHLADSMNLVVTHCESAEVKFEVPVIIHTIYILCCGYITHEAEVEAKGYVGYFHPAIKQLLHRIFTEERDRPGFLDSLRERHLVDTALKMEGLRSKIAESRENFDSLYHFKYWQEEGLPYTTIMGSG